MSLPATLLAVLQAQTLPLTAAQLAKQLPAKVKPALVAAAMGELAAAGQAHAFTQGKGIAYTDRPPLDLCAQALAEKVGALTTATAPAKLRAALPKALQPWFDEALGRLIVQGRAHWLPKGKSRLVLPRRILPSDVMSASQLVAVQKVLNVAGRYRATSVTLADFLAWLDGDGESMTSQPSPAPVVAAPTSELLSQWYRLDRAHSSSSMVPVPHTYRRYQAWAAAQQMSAGESAFRQALEDLYNAGQAILEPCERPQDLPEEERRLQVPLTFGPPGYYWSPVT